MTICSIVLLVYLAIGSMFSFWALNTFGQRANWLEVIADLALWPIALAYMLFYYWKS
jgi:hypothetical protein